MVRFVVGVATLLFALSTPAYARDGDEEACEGKEAGDPCTRSRGEEGTCQPDDSDPDVLTCDDDAGPAPLPSGDGGPDGAPPTGSASPDDGSGCATTGGAAALGLALVGGALAARRRR